MATKRTYEQINFFIFQLIGWFFFASGIIVKGAIINGIFGDEKRSFGDDISGLQNMLPESLKVMNLLIRTVSYSVISGLGANYSNRGVTIFMLQREEKLFKE